MPEQCAAGVLLAATLGFAPCGVAQSLVNGSFELPGHGDWPAWAYFVQNAPTGFDTGYRAWFFSLPPGSSFLTGWTISGGGVDYFSGPHLYCSGPTDGAYYLDLVLVGPQGGVISQVVTGLKPGTNYFLFFDVWQTSRGPGSVITATAGDVTRLILNSTPRRWQTHSLPFTARGTTTTVSFAAPEANALNDGVLLDNVRLSEASNAAINLEAQRAVAIKVEGFVGKTYRVEYATDAAPQAWSLLTRVVLTNSPSYVYDMITPGTTKRFYRAIEE